jgi:uncharacterized glyoxalase superfamily protein PhnB
MAKAKTTGNAKKRSKPAAKASRKATRRTPARRAATRPIKEKSSRGFQLASLAPSLTVNDLAQSMKWYCDVIGFSVQQRWEREGALVGAELQAGDVTVYLSQEDGQKGRDRIKGEGFRLYWYTDQVDQIAAGIKARGGTLASEPKDEWGARSFNLVDPTGYKITITTD